METEERREKIEKEKDKEKRKEEWGVEAILNLLMKHASL